MAGDKARRQNVTGIIRRAGYEAINPWTHYYGNA